MRPPQSMHFGLGPARLCRLDKLGGLDEPIESFIRLLRHPVNLPSWSPRPVATSVIAKHQHRGNAHRRALEASARIIDQQVQ
jgi:hypothetical protein